MSEKKPSRRKNALGRGLGALLDDSTPSKDTYTPSQISSVDAIELENIETNPYQPRQDFDKTALQELADSIKTQGIIQPITVRKLEKDRYQLISGERRLLASKLAGLKEIVAYIRVADDQQMLEMALIENIQRENLNAIEIALSYQRLISECDLKQEELGDRVGKNRSTVNNYLRLLKLPPDIQIAIRDGKLSMGHARALINIDDVTLQLNLFKKIMQQGLSVRKVEELVRNLDSSGPRTAEREKVNKGPEIKQLQHRLSSHFGTKVVVNQKKSERGEIKIPFVSTEDLNRILEIIDY